MDLLDIPFRKIHPQDFPRPLLPVKIINPHTGKHVTLLGLIDTGADECAIPAFYAPLIGHNLTAGTTKSINTGNGPSTAYGHTICIEVQGKKIDDVVIDFLPNLCVVLLGVKSFLSNFMLIVDYKNQKFSLKDHPLP